MAWQTGVRLPAVRTASYAMFARSVFAFSGIGESHDAVREAAVVDVDRRSMREAIFGDDEQAWQRLGSPSPDERGGALMVHLSPTAVLLLCGSGHESGGDMLSPWVLELVLEGV